MVRVAWARITGPIGAGLLSDEERERAGAFRSASRARQFVAGRVLLRTLLGRVAPDAASRPIRADARGRIALEGGGPGISVAHTEGWVAVAAAAGAVGVDIEGQRPLPRARDLSQRFYHATEHAELAGLSEPETEGLFLDRWVLKEALAKATGEGLAAVIGRLEVRRGPPWAPRGRTAEGTDGADFHLGLFQLRGGARLGVAARGDADFDVAQGELPGVEDGGPGPDDAKADLAGGF